uniref:Uncharacterized protein n=1 Tax=Pseudonaja textilis TaxID=8673 RepID=A0A670YVR7_PSETE
MKALMTLSLLIFFTAGREAKIFARCHLASFLKLKGLDGYHGIRLNDWICLVHHGSGFNSKWVTSRKNRLIQFFGIFQINSRWWCDNNQGYSANLCKVSCSGNLTQGVKPVAHGPDISHADHAHPWFSEGGKAEIRHVITTCRREFDTPGLATLRKLLCPAL